jgi:regulator of replication initiation timing
MKKGKKMKEQKNDKGKTEQQQGAEQKMTHVVSDYSAGHFVFSFIYQTSRNNDESKILPWHSFQGNVSLWLGNTLGL